MRAVLPAAMMVAVMMLAAGPAPAQPRPFTCVGAEDLEDEVVAVPFAPGRTALGEAGRAAIATAAALAAEQPGRHLCVLGHGDRGAGVDTARRQAIGRARAVADALAAAGVARGRIRAEARVGAYSGREQEPGARAVTIVLMPGTPEAE